MATLSQSFPSRPLNSEDRDTIRARPEVAQFTSVDSDAEQRRHGGVCTAIALVDATIVFTEFDRRAEIWTDEVIDEDVDEVEHMQVVLRYVDQQEHG